MDDLDRKGSETFSKGSEPFSKGPEPFSKGSKTFAKGFETFAKGFETFAKGSEPFSKGSETFYKGSETFTKGSEPFSKGSETFSKGSETFAKCSDTFAKGSETVELISIVHTVVKYDVNKYNVDLQSISIVPGATCRTFVRNDDDVQFMLGEDRVIPQMYNEIFNELNTKPNVGSNEEVDNETNIHPVDHVENTDEEPAQIQ
ncbi:hypothetical protein Dsin_001749 [Dipteronia sinensis]|uniref:Uncharacterized protein n=1 Tax=Dipteronia sinensis TaxID=43782 RepID=A0AAE0EIM5_9ROSI|nr:hypothetical protein Dsin_001749 [Dipteronia sinensis]